MKRRGPRHNSRDQSSVPQPAPNDCWAVIRVDGTRLRKKVLKDHEKALRDLARTREQHDRFHQTDQPQFARWMSSQFGELLTELRELDQQRLRDEGLVFMVETEVMMGGGSYARAYRRVTEPRDNPEPPPGHPGRDRADRQGDLFDAGPDPRAPDGGNDPMEEFFNDIFGKPGPDDASVDPWGGWPGPHPGNRPAETEMVRLKELYRAVVRRLHPDRQRTVTAQMTEWWHQAQAAYEAGDADRLEVILTLCEIDDRGSAEHASVSLLQRITEQTKRSLRELRRQLSGLRADPAWNFSQRTDHEVLAARIRSQLIAAITITREQLGELQAVIAEWKSKAERLKQPRGRKGR